MTDKPLDIQLTELQYEQIEKLSAANYSPKKIAIYLGVDEQLFQNLIEDKTGKIYKAFYRGQLIVNAGIDINLVNSAASGSVTAIQIQMKRKAELDFEQVKNEIFGL